MDAKQKKAVGEMSDSELIAAIFAPGDGRCNEEKYPLDERLTKLYQRPMWKVVDCNDKEQMLDDRAFAEVELALYEWCGAMAMGYLKN